MKKYNTEECSSSGLTHNNTYQVDSSQIRTYLRVLYGRVAQGWVAVHFWRSGQKGFPGQYFPVSRLDEAIRSIIAKATSGYNLWVRVTPLRSRPAKGRGKEPNTAALTALYLDVDYGQVGHKKKQLPPDREAAMKVLDGVVQRLGGRRPTMVVNSGHGLQAYWLLEEPWASEDVREAKALVDALNRLFLHVSKEMGYDADSVGDLARVLRVPGTWNVKVDKETGKPLEPVRAEIVEVDEARRYSVADMRAPLSAWSPSTMARCRKAEDSKPARSLPVEFPELPRIELEDLRVEPPVKALIRDGPPRNYPKSRSEAVYGVVLALAEAGHTHEEIVAVLLDQRWAISQRHYVDGNGRPRPNPREYAEREVNRILMKHHTEREEARSGRGSLLARRASEVVTRPVRWLWRPYIPRGCVTLVDGDPGVGKSSLMLEVAAGLTRGTLPIGIQCDPSDVIYFVAEDSVEHTIVPRFQAMGGDCERLHLVLGVRRDGYEDMVTLAPEDLSQVEDLIRQHHVSMVVLDPLFAFLGHVDSWKPEQARPAMTRLIRLAERTQCAVVGIRHLTKGARERALYRGLGSIDFAAAARSVLLVGTDPLNEEIRVMAQAKSSLSRPGRSLAFTVVGEDDGAATVRWVGESSLTAEDLVGAHSQEVQEEASALQEAMQFLEEMLRDGPVPADQVCRAARKLSIAEPTLRRAKRRLGVVSDRPDKANPHHGVWVWMLPGGPGAEPHPPQPASADAVGRRSSPNTQSMIILPKACEPRNDAASTKMIKDGQMIIFERAFDTRSPDSSDRDSSDRREAADPNMCSKMINDRLGRELAIPDVTRPHAKMIKMINRSVLGEDDHLPRVPHECRHDAVSPDDTPSGDRPAAIDSNRQCPISKERREVLELLRQRGPMKPAEIAATTGRPTSSMRRLLRHMKLDGEVIEVGGAYLARDVSSLVRGDRPDRGDRDSSQVGADASAHAIASASEAIARAIASNSGSDAVQAHTDRGDRDSQDSSTSSRPDDDPNGNGSDSSRQFTDSGNAGIASQESSASSLPDDDDPDGGGHGGMAPHIEKSDEPNLPGQPDSPDTSTQPQQQEILFRRGEIVLTPDGEAYDPEPHGVDPWEAEVVKILERSMILHVEARLVSDEVLSKVYGW